MYKQPRNISRKFEKHSSSRTGDFTDNLILVRNIGDEHTERQPRKLKLSEINIKTSLEYIPKIWER